MKSFLEFEIKIECNQMTHSNADGNRIILWDNVADVAECTTGAHNCHALADCVEKDGGYDCICHPGTEGNGKVCGGEFRLLSQTFLCLSILLCSCDVINISISFEEITP